MLYGNVCSKEREFSAHKESRFMKGLYVLSTTLLRPTLGHKETFMDRLTYIHTAYNLKKTAYLYWAPNLSKILLKAWFKKIRAYARLKSKTYKFIKLVSSHRIITIRESFQRLKHLPNHTTAISSSQKLAIAYCLTQLDSKLKANLSTAWSHLITFSHMQKMRNSSAQQYRVQVLFSQLIKSLKFSQQSCFSQIKQYSIYKKLQVKHLITVLQHAVQRQQAFTLGRLCSYATKPNYHDVVSPIAYGSNASVAISKLENNTKVTTLVKERIRTGGGKAVLNSFWRLVERRLQLDLSASFNRIKEMGVKRIHVKNSQAFIFSERINGLVVSHGKALLIRAFLNLKTHKRDHSDNEARINPQRVTEIAIDRPEMDRERQVKSGSHSPRKHNSNNTGIINSSSGDKGDIRSSQKRTGVSRDNQSPEKRNSQRDADERMADIEFELKRERDRISSPRHGQPARNEIYSANGAEGRDNNQTGGIYSNDHFIDDGFPIKRIYQDELGRTVEENIQKSDRFTYRRSGSIRSQTGSNQQGEMPDIKKSEIKPRLSQEGLIHGEEELCNSPRTNKMRGHSDSRRFRQEPTEVDDIRYDDYNSSHQNIRRSGITEKGTQEYNDRKPTSRQQEYRRPIQDEPVQRLSPGRSTHSEDQERYSRQDRDYRTNKMVHYAISEPRNSRERGSSRGILRNSPGYRVEENLRGHDQKELSSLDQRYSAENRHISGENRHISGVSPTKTRDQARTRQNNLGYDNDDLRNREGPVERGSSKRRLNQEEQDYEITQRKDGSRLRPHLDSNSRNNDNFRDERPRHFGMQGEEDPEYITDISKEKRVLKACPVAQEDFAYALQNDPDIRQNLYERFSHTEDPENDQDEHERKLNRERAYYIPPTKSSLDKTRHKSLRHGQRQQRLQLGIVEEASGQISGSTDLQEQERNQTSKSQLHMITSKDYHEERRLKKTLPAFSERVLLKH